MTGTLAVLRQALHRLVDETDVLLVDVEAQQAQSSSGTATNTVQELERLTHQVVVVLVILVSQKVLKFKKKLRLVRRYSVWEVLLQQLWASEAKVGSQSTHVRFPQAIQKTFHFFGSRHRGKFNLLLLLYIQSSHTITPCLWKQKHFFYIDHLCCLAGGEVNQYPGSRWRTHSDSAHSQLSFNGRMFWFRAHS